MRADLAARLLPDVYRRVVGSSAPLGAILDVMERLHAPVEAVLADLPTYFDPQRTPPSFVPFLARWVDLDRWLDDGSDRFDTGTGRLRQVVAAASELSRMRGTAEGLRCALEWALGISGVSVVADATPFHVVVTLPSSAEEHRDLVARIVAQEKPAHATAEIVYSGDAPARFVGGPPASGSTSTPPPPAGPSPATSGSVASAEPRPTAGAPPIAPASTSAAPGLSPASTAEESHVAPHADGVPAPTDAGTGADTS